MPLIAANILARILCQNCKCLLVSCNLTYGMRCLYFERMFVWTTFDNRSIYGKVIGVFSYIPFITKNRRLENHMSSLCHNRLKYDSISTTFLRVKKRFHKSIIAIYKAWETKMRNCQQTVYWKRVEGTNSTTASNSWYKYNWAFSYYLFGDILAS